MNKKQYIAPAFEVIEMSSPIMSSSSPTLTDKNATGNQLSGKKSSSSIWDDESSSSGVWGE